MEASEGEDLGRKLLWVMREPGGTVPPQQVPATRDLGMGHLSGALGEDPGVAQGGEAHGTQLSYNARMEQKLPHH